MTTNQATVTYTVTEDANGLHRMEATITHNGQTITAENWHLAEDIAREALLPTYAEYSNLQEAADMVADQRSNTSTADTVTADDLTELHYLNGALAEAVGTCACEELLRKLPSEQYKDFGRELEGALSVIESLRDDLGMFIEDAEADLEKADQ